MERPTGNFPRRQKEEKHLREEALCAQKQRHGECITVLLRKYKESGMITAPGAGEGAGQGQSSRTEPPPWGLAFVLGTG